jgi:hypothetical protein
VAVTLASVCESFAGVSDQVRLPMKPVSVVEVRTAWSMGLVEENSTRMVLLSSVPALIWRHQGFPVVMPARGMRWASARISDIGYSE